ncbi:MAG: protein kinase [Akkermansia sp.]|nr:protein kinase [Akkermansia sp.]
MSNGIVTHVVKECAPLHFSQRDANGAIHPIPGCEDDFNKLRDDFNNEIDTLNAASGKDTRIVHLVDEFDDNHTKYYVMAHLPGGSLHDLRSETKKAFNEDELKKVLDDLLGALEALHAANIIHRDIKPQNIMRTASDDSVLIDFGSACFMWKKAKAIRAASPHWAPPEEFATDYADNIGPHTDLYELGATIYYLITGKAFHHPDLVSKLKNIYSAAHKMTIDEVQKLVAPYLLRPCKEIMEMKAYSIGFRKALCKALEPDISKRLASAKEWKELISEERLKAERTREELREIDETIKTHPERIDAAMIKKLQRLKGSRTRATLSLTKCYKHLWRKAEKEQMPKDAKKNLELYETYLKEARESRIKGAFREAATHLLRHNCGKMDEASMKKAIDWYTQDELPQQAQSCNTALGVMRTYKRLARLVGFTGAHNMYLQGKHAAKECALLPQEGAQNIHPQLRGIAQLLCLLLSCGLCLPLIWLMALVEYKKISHYISPIHLTELND